MLLKKTEKDLEAELSMLKRRAEKLENELGRIEKIEKSLAHQELVLAKKIIDMNRLEQELAKLVSKEELEGIRSDLRKIDEHESVLIENSKSLRLLMSEIEKIKEQHTNVRTQSFQERKGSEELKAWKEELHQRISDIEHQNKLIMKYLKRLDDLLQQKIGI